jgi:hypothetical protein
VKLINFLSGAGVLFAALAAVLWGWSSIVNLPIIGSGYGEIANLGPFYKALKTISRLNAFAAGSAFVSALLQAVALYMSLPH